MAKHLVKCRCCKQQFDAQPEGKDKEWIMPSKNWYYHLTCYNDWAKKKNDVHSQADEDLWFGAVWDYLAKDWKIELNYVKVKQQWDNFVGRGYTPKGIYFCIRYFYEVKHGDVNKSEGGIGIIPYIYEEGANYWTNKELTDRGICARIEEQIRQAQSQEVITIKKSQKKKPKLYDLSEI